MLKNQYKFVHQLSSAIVRKYPFLQSKARGGIHHLVYTVLLMGFSLWLRLLIAPVETGLQYVTFFPAVTLAAVFGGLRAGLLATAIGTLLATYIFTPPYFDLSVESLRASFLSNIVFILDGIVISYSIETMHRYRRQYQIELEVVKASESRVAALNAELEQRVEQRTALLLAAKQEAEHSSEAKSQFLSRMSHELRTPLNAVMGYAALLKIDTDEPLSKLHAENVQEIINAGQHLLNLVNEMLELNAIEQGQLMVRIEPVPVQEMIKACAAQIQPLANQRGIRVELVSSIPCAVQADYVRLKQVLLNLLSNAVKFNRDGGSIQISWIPVENQQVRINVRDTGNGIAAETIPRLFKPFGRVESAYQGIDGLGIGLVLTKNFVYAMHGNIGVESTVGQGSNFWFELPLATLDEQGASSPAAIADIHKILYIEDNPSNLKLVQTILRTRKNIVFVSAMSGSAGLDIALNERPALILLDINMRGMDGYEVLGHLRDNPATRDIPVIAVTANVMTKDVDRGMQAGFDEYLSKPLDVKNFLETLDRFLAH